MYHSIKVLKVLFEINLCIKVSLGFSVYALGDRWRWRKGGHYMTNTFVVVCCLWLRRCSRWLLSCWSDLCGCYFASCDYFIYFIKFHIYILDPLLTTYILPRCLHKDDTCKKKRKKIQGWMDERLNFTVASSWQQWEKETWYFTLWGNIKS